ncbi:ABC transporter ATP-binding protein [Pseudonocardia spinosispora]|uniref:ABC transporter ATP-binding protein n=1 Tax=Pseudonocardia spinosispora TaxID=103441 RepID=UPI0012EC5E06|nr:ABC transporter ATP-binding protein [Pseudonocardia spinosispora]
MDLGAAPLRRATGRRTSPRAEDSGSKSSARSSTGSTSAKSAASAKAPKPGKSKKSSAKQVKGDIKDIGLLRQLWRYRRYGRTQMPALLVGLLMRIGELLADLATPWPLALVIDHLFQHKPLAAPVQYIATLAGDEPLAILSVAAASVLVITGFSGLFDYLGDRMMNGAGERITSAIRTDVFGQLQRLPMRYHDKHAVGELTSRIATDTARIEDSLVGIFSTLIPGTLTLLGITGMLLAMDWRLGLIALCAAPLVFFTAIRYTRLTRKSARRQRAAEGVLSGFVAESLQGIRTIQAYGRQDLHDERFGSDNEKVLKTGLRAVELRARFTPLLETVAALGSAALLFVGGIGVVNNWWQVGVLIVVTSYLRSMLAPMRQLSKLTMTFTKGAASAERVSAIIDQTRPVIDIRQPLPVRTLGGIQLRDVGLDYGRGPVLNNLNLAIYPGERIVLFGQNGAGKSTVLSLIAGLYPPTRGSVRLDGFPLADVPEWWLHRQVAVVLQDTFLFSGTLIDNIRYGRPEATDEEVLAVAEAALVTEFAAKLPDGMNTKLSDGGTGLSGGQRQRVGIARALLLDSPVVLLDEPTTGLDVNAEELVVKALTKLVQGRTVVMTTHTPALTRLATRTVQLQRGALAPQGPMQQGQMRPPPPGRPRQPVQQPAPIEQADAPEQQKTPDHTP